MSPTDTTSSERSESHLGYQEEVYKLLVGFLPTLPQHHSQSFYAQGEVQGPALTGSIQVKQSPDS